MMHIALIPLALLTMSTPEQGGATSPSREPVLPPAILDYYRRHNFVTAFSTREERQVLAHDPGSARDPRLVRVARLMRQLESYVVPMDPGMTKRSRSASAVAYRSDLLRIKSVRMEDGGARVELERHTIGPAQNQFYIARFGELAPGDRMPDFSELALAGAESVVWSEVHHWCLDDGPWLRATPTTHFVAQ